MPQLLAQPEQGSSLGQQRATGHAHLISKKRGPKTVIETLYQKGCAKIRIPRRGAQTLEAVMINTSGGMVGGDALEWSFRAGCGTDVTVTSQACERIYKSSGECARTHIVLDIESGARLNWLPQETLLFDHANFHRQLTINMSRHSEVLILEPIIFGRVAMNETIQVGSATDNWDVFVEGERLHSERLTLSGPINHHLERPFVTNGNMALATLLLIAESAESHVDALRSVLGDHGAVSFWNGKLLARIVAPSSYDLRQRLIEAIPLLNGGAPLPKIWAT